MSSIKQDNEIHVSYEDQQSINKFARFNARLQDYKEEHTARKKILQNLEDAADELLMLDDPDAPVPYLVGECFFESTPDDATKMLEKAKEKEQELISNIESRISKHEGELSRLKATLYAKFGNNINLEADEQE